MEKRWKYKIEDYAEKVWFGIKKAKNEKESEKIKKSYEFALLKKIPKEFPNRIAYQRVIKLLKRFSKEKAEEIPSKEKNSDEIKYDLKRIELVKNWIELFGSKNIKTNSPK